MIGKVAGRIDYIAEDHVLIEAAGVGYLVYCSPRTLAALPPAGEAAALYTEMVVREDLMQLYGFTTLAEKEWHRLLTSVQGVGAKAALAILGALGQEGVGRAIALGDTSAIRAAPGIGPKIAARVANELKDKAPGVMALGAGGARKAGPTKASNAPAVASDAAATADALSALVNLGYGHGEAAAAVAEAAGNAPDAPSGELIRAALRLLAPKG
jgi:Holliday junction DNA helicase RuvA